ncbi:MAG: sulfate transporter [Planctomycetes bacterium]|nr:sulfate transporter [Planctomycetota bacterium]
MTSTTLSAVPSSRASAVGRDLVSGLVVCLVALPLCLGIAHASGAPLISGLVSGILGGIVVGLLSGSHISVSGPAAGLAAIVVAQINGLGSFEAFLLAVLMAGALQIVLGLARAGALANFFPNTVIKGLLVAIGALLILKQVPHLLGHDVDYEGDFSFRQEDGRNTISEFGQLIGAFLPGAALVGLSCVAVLVVWERSRLKKSMIPGALVAVLLGVAMSELLRWTGSSWAIAQNHLVSVPVVGTQGMGWGDLLRFPDFSRWSDPAVLSAAATLAIVASLETLLNLEATDKLDPLRRTSPPNRELLAQGAGNLLAGLIGGLPMTSVIVRSSVNAQSGGRTRLAAIVHGVLLLGSVLLLPTLLNRIPLAALAAILIVTGFKLASPKVFRQMWSEGVRQFLPFLITILSIVFTDLLLGVMIGLGISIAFILWGNLRRGFRVIREEHTGGLVHRIELASHANFLNRARLMTTLGAFKSGDQVAIDARMTDDMDLDVLSMIREFAGETAPARGISVSLFGFRDRYPLRDVQQYVDWTTKEIQAKLTPSRVLQLLKEGNERFASDRRLNRDLVRQVDATSAGQHPMAVVLSCIDSRSPAEILFDLGLGDIFNARLAGNVSSAQVLGSVEYACKVAGSKLIVVLGHTRCGAVKATCELVSRGAHAVGELTNLPSITDTIAEAVRMETRTLDHRDGDNEQFVDRVAALNVRNTMRRIEAGSPVLRSMILNGELAIVGAMYDVATGRVGFLDGAGALVPTAEKRPSAMA